MIRPITLICWILALGSGLYLYRAKHDVELMDKHIEQVAKETSDIRADSRHLLDEWIRLSEPEQLRKYSDEYLGLKSIVPPQFVRLSDLPNRLPAPRADPPEDSVDASAQATTDQPASADQPAGTDDADAGGLPVPPIPPAAVTLTSAASPGVIAPPLQARPVTPRGQPETGAEKPRPPAETPAAEEPHTAAPKPAVAEQRPAAPVQTAGQPTRQAQQAAPVPRGLPPLQAQGAPARTPPLQGALPLQAQGEPRLVALRPGEPRVTEGRAPEPWAGGHPAPGPVQSPQIARQPLPPLQAPTGSLLGGSRGPVPIPLPAPTPVSATWPGSSR